MPNPKRSEFILAHEEISDVKPRLFVLFADDADRAVILRRGPSNQVRLILWNTETDEIQRGQWLGGRLHPERCAISPDGKLISYFAVRKKNGATFTAISRPPFFTPLAVWEEQGTRGGGGFFVSSRHFLTNTRLNRKDVATGFTLPDNFIIEPAWDPPVERKERDGYHPHFEDLLLECCNHFIDGEQNPYCELYDKKKGRKQTLENVVWAAWDKRGDLLFVKEGCIYRCAVHQRHLAEAVLIDDFCPDVFTKMPPPEFATIWPDI